MIKLRLKGILSSVLIVLFLVVAVSGAMLYFGRTGLIMGIPRGVIRDAHIWSGFAMTAAVPLHLILNLRVFRGELKSLAKGILQVFGVSQRR